jgi:hypothetical protein
MLKGRGLVRQGIILTGLGVGVWAVSILFFLLFGDWVVPGVGSPSFGPSLFLLEILTFLLLIGMAFVVRLKLLRERGSATRFGFVSAAVGLLLNTFIVWYRDSVFPAFDEGQHHSFTVWMTLAYALTLLVPAIVDRLVKEPESPVESPVVHSENRPEEETEETRIHSETTAET